MKNVSHKKKWNSGVVNLHVEPPPIPLIKRKHNDNLEKDVVNIKLCRYPTSERLDLYEFKIFLFKNGNLEEFLLCVSNFNITLKASGMIDTGAKVQYICKLVNG